MRWRFVTILLQIEPATDSTSLANLAPVFQSMAQSFKSYHTTPSPTTTVVWLVGRSTTVQRFVVASCTM